MSETEPAVNSSLRRPHQSIFSPDWRVYAKTKTATNIPVDIRQTAIITGALQAIIQRALGGQMMRHLTILPLAQVGFPEPSASLQGLAMCAPGSDRKAEFERLDASLMKMAEVSTETGRRELVVKVASMGQWRLSLQGKSEDPTLQPARYSVAAYDWGTVTPVILSTACRVDDLAQRRERATTEIARACAEIGLPQPIEMQFSVKSNIAGVPALQCSTGSPFGSDWKVPEQLVGRPMHHVLLRFSQPVQGPVLLGAGRFRGIGVFLPFGPIPRQ